MEVLPFSKFVDDNDDDVFVKPEQKPLKELFPFSSNILSKTKIKIPIEVEYVEAAFENRFQTFRNKSNKDFKDIPAFFNACRNVDLKKTDENLKHQNLKVN
jgi:hypothetical protein